MKEKDNKPSTESMQSLVGEIKQIIHDARAHAIRSVDFCRVQIYWAIGQRIVEKEQPVLHRRPKVQHLKIWSTL